MRSVTWWRRLRGTARTAAFERDMAVELALHIELEAELLVGRGMSPEDARAEARRRFGSVAQVRDECRDSWGLRAVDALAQDVRYALRMLAKHPAHTALVMVTLALGIGANTAIFGVVHAVLLRSLPYAHGDALIEVRQQANRAGLETIPLSAQELADYRRDATSLDAIVEYHQMSFNLLDSFGESASRVVTGVVSPDFFDVIGVKPMLGRTFNAGDDGHDAPPVLIVSYAYWQKALGGDPNVLGRTFEMNDRVHTVVGVLPPVPQYPEDNDVYMPVSACPFRSAPASVADRRARMVSAIGRMKPGVSVERAGAELGLIASRMAATYPSAYEPGAGFSATALAVRRQLTDRARPALLLLLATTLFVLLVACANVANLTLARLAGRDRELTLRTALGAGRARIARQLLTESALVAAGGGVLGLGMAAITRDLLVAYTSRFTPRAAEIGIDSSVLLFAFAISAATALLVGIVPLVREVLAHGAAARLRARHTLVATQVGLSFVLLICAGLMARSFINLRSVDAGFNADRVLTARIDLDWVKYDSLEKRRTFFRPLLETLEREPDVTSAALSLTFPLDQSTPMNMQFLVEGRRQPAGRPRAQADFRLVSPGYFQTLGMTLLQGRAFTPADRAGSPPVAIINLAMARHQFGDADAIGRRVSFDNGYRWLTIVGVVNDVKQYGLDTSASDELYMPFDQRGPLSASLLVRTAGDPMAMLRTVQRVAREIDPRQPVSRPLTLEQVRSSALTSPKLTMLLVSMFAAVALVITAAGIGGVASFAVSQRTVEIGVRMALGAPRASVTRMLVGQGLKPVSIGLACGAVAAAAATRALARLLYAVEPTDQPTFLFAALTLTAVAAFACLLPARRAASIQLTDALRAD